MTLIFAKIILNLFIIDISKIILLKVIFIINLFIIIINLFTTIINLYVNIIINYLKRLFFK